MNYEFSAVTNPAQIKKLAGVAKQIWFEYFPGIITVEQVEYMVDKFQSVHAITEQTSNGGYEYFLVLGDGEILGYVGFKAEADKLFLSKLYLKKEARGKGHFSKMFTFVEQAAQERGLKSLYLTVNKYNDHSIEVYRKKGFTVIEEKAADIGRGFIMDDYIMEKVL
jgi:diamine N-acetyltransferase